ncbi:hypothetical protein BK661_29535 [Pseudomonas frederiksbergensis]|uniref:Uncharacterized protein n=1 Tax=Pseudomonas frederiksbergensis TaxID=104087 RepID=A0A423HIU9_9PSED|nr:hypothetical protein BK661_29535 [Pseudomonas frederiksbergensis]
MPVLWNTEDERRHIRYLREDKALACYLQRALYLGSSRVMSNIFGDVFQAGDYSSAWPVTKIYCECPQLTSGSTVHVPSRA